MAHRVSVNPPSWMISARRLMAFLLSGGTAFATDLCLLWALIEVGTPALLARLLSISCAIIVAWLANRTFTFRVVGRPRFKEFLRYSALAWSVALLNYSLFAGMIALNLISSPLLATALSSATAMAASYLGMRYGVFRGSAL